MRKSRIHLGLDALAVLTATLLVTYSHAQQATNDNSIPISYTQQERLLSDVLAFRSLAIHRPDVVRMTLNKLLSAGDETVANREYADAVWQQFFAASIVKIGRAASARPISLYYSPPLDVALLVVWKQTAPSRHEPVLLRLIPAERLEDAHVSATPELNWTTRDRPLEQLATLTQQRLARFAATHPVRDDTPTPADEEISRDSRIARARLLTAVGSLQALANTQLKEEYLRYASGAQSAESKGSQLRPIFVEEHDNEVFLVVSVKEANPRHLSIATFRLIENGATLERTVEILL